VLDVTMSRYEFLAQAHQIVRPKVYLEVGVQSGASLVQAFEAELAIGIDPYPQVTQANQRPNQRVHSARSADHFAAANDAYDTHPYPAIDFAFIDGSHLFEDALRDFINIERHLAGPRSIVLFDDVLPYNEAIAARVQPPGDWTGDVWKVAEILETQWAHLRLTLIDVAPTGLLMVQSDDWPLSVANWGDLLPSYAYDKIVASWLAHGEQVMPEYITRENAVSAAAALDMLREGRGE
jgi:predicted O-methyltransferase YrrM